MAKRCRGRKLKKWTNLDVDLFAKISTDLSRANLPDKLKGKALFLFTSNR
jgi:hypothetical protein